MGFKKFRTAITNSLPEAVLSDKKRKEHRKRDLERVAKGDAKVYRILDTPETYDFLNDLDRLYEIQCDPATTMNPNWINQHLFTEYGGVCRILYKYIITCHITQLTLLGHC
jgi:hypothetical protein